MPGLKEQLLSVTVSAKTFLTFINLPGIGFTAMSNIVCKFGVPEGIV